MFKYHTKNHKMIDHFTLMVKDIDKSLKFYQNALGLDLVSENNNEYNMGIEDKILFTLTTRDDVIPKVKTTGLYHFALLLPNRNELGNLLHHFLKTEQRITGGSDHHVSEALYLNDPDMNGIEIYADYPDSKWEFYDNEVKMVTEPMDYENLIKSRTSDKPFKMPKETIVGHLHFHVNNLLRANNFFIDVLGFDQMLNARSAIFLSSGNYHHHIGINIWNGLNAINRPDNMAGLADYHLNVPTSELDDFVETLKDNRLEIKEDIKGKYFLDINEVKVYF
ncbi:MAG TPA: VOC family protein [Acholeplasma sp.]|nr:VOC family protein [Acholeplasma sp.]